MDDPIEWLRAQLDQDELRALSLPQLGYLNQPPPFGAPYPPLAFQRDTALAEIAVKRTILARYEELTELELDAELERAVIALAQPYADREGFPGGWTRQSRST